MSPRPRVWSRLQSAYYWAVVLAGLAAAIQDLIARTPVAGGAYASGLSVGMSRATVLVFLCCALVSLWDRSFSPRSALGSRVILFSAVAMAMSHVPNAPWEASLPGLASVEDVALAIAALWVVGASVSDEEGGPVARWILLLAPALVFTPPEAAYAVAVLVLFVVGLTRSIATVAALGVCGILSFFVQDPTVVQYAFHPTLWIIAIYATAQSRRKSPMTKDQKVLTYMVTICRSLAAHMSRDLTDDEISIVAQWVDAASGNLLENPRLIRLLPYEKVAQSLVADADEGKGAEAMRAAIVSATQQSIDPSTNDQTLLCPPDDW